jgi:CO dehydrogenase/acetyl-CoA synthase epsilon subunit
MITSIRFVILASGIQVKFAFKHWNDIVSIQFYIINILILCKWLTDQNYNGLDPGSQDDPAVALGLWRANNKMESLLKLLLSRAQRQQTFYIERKHLHASRK